MADQASHAHGGLTPSAWVLRWAHVLAPGARVLDVACGSGRNMAALHALGCHVTGVDRDSAALARAAQWGQTVCADIEGDTWPLTDMSGQPLRFDAVVVTNYLWRDLMPTLRASVAPGGWLIYETFAQGNEALGKPSRPEFLLQRGELLQWLPGWRVLAFEDGALRQPDRCVQRIVAQAPGQALSNALLWLE